MLSLVQLLPSRHGMCREMFARNLYAGLKCVCCAPLYIILHSLVGHQGLHSSASRYAGYACERGVCDMRVRANLREHSVVSAPVCLCYVCACYVCIQATVLMPGRHFCSVTPHCCRQSVHEGMTTWQLHISTFVLSSAELLGGDPGVDALGC